MINFNFKNMLKISFFIIGVLVCFAIGGRYLLYEKIGTNNISWYYNTEHFDRNSQEELNVVNNILHLYKISDYESINKIIKIAKDEFELILNGARSFPITYTPVAEIVIKNISEKTLIFFEPSLTRLTSESYNYNNMIQDDYAIDCPINFSNRCHILKPSERFSMPVLFEVNSLGKHKVNISLSFPQINKLSKSDMESISSTVAYINYIFDVE